MNEPNVSKTERAVAVGCSDLLGSTIIDLAERHQVKPSTLLAWYEQHRKNSQQPRQANPIPLSPSQIEGLHNLRKAFRQLLSHEKCAEAHSTQQHKGQKYSCDAMLPNDQSSATATGGELPKPKGNDEK
jgi:transposase-like protein